MCLQIGRQVIQESFSSVWCGLVLFGFVSFCHVELWWFQKRAPSAGSFDLLDQSYLVSIHRQPLEATVGDRRTRVWSMALKSVVSNLVSDLAGQHSHDHHAFGQVASSFTAFFPDVAPHHDQFLPSMAPETVHQGDAVHLDQFNESLMATRRPKMPVSFHKEEEEKKDGWCECFCSPGSIKERWCAQTIMECCFGNMSQKQLPKLQQFPLGTEMTGPFVDIGCFER